MSSRTKESPTPRTQTPSEEDGPIRQATSSNTPPSQPVHSCPKNEGRMFFKSHGQDQAV